MTAEAHSATAQRDPPRSPVAVAGQIPPTQHRHGGHTNRGPRAPTRMGAELVVTDLVTCARKGDKQAWDALVERYSPLIWMPCLICSLAALSVSKTRALLRRNPARWVSSSPKVMVPTPWPLTQSGGRNGEIQLSMLRWRRASDCRTAIVVNILPTLATFTMTSGPMASCGGSAAVRARPEAKTRDLPMSVT